MTWIVSIQRDIENVNNLYVFVKIYLNNDFFR